MAPPVSASDRSHLTDPSDRSDPSHLSHSPRLPRPPSNPVRMPDGTFL